MVRGNTPKCSEIFLRCHVDFPEECGGNSAYVLTF